MDQGAHELHKLCIAPYAFRKLIVMSIILEAVCLIYFLYCTVLFIKGNYWILAAGSLFVVAGRTWVNAIPRVLAFLKCELFVYLEPEKLRLADRLDNTVTLIPKSQVVAIRVCMIEYTDFDEKPWKAIALSYDLSYFERKIPCYSVDVAVTDRYMMIEYRLEYVEILQKHLNVPVIDEVEEEKESEEFEREIARKQEDERRRQIAQARAIQEEIDRRQQAALQEAFMREQENAAASDCVVLPENGTDEEENTDAP